ncbi:AEC family transporter [Psychrobacter sp. FDAARGOS_221]|uniref:AEC family transporter n=1 Tax=Psychrobacter sp. FDAARGOS_221 TaxID=1975705 RepID=UPI000BB5682B|nr:AEC family transporter [Psychrobacter sp. FDAARGOS_221]PNK61389.1 AEC family transporter [Psychrobacter sp. FDAARGOS_221]
MLDAILFALTIVLPNLILMGLGFFMRKQGQVSKAFIDQASKLVFNYALPCLLFFSVVQSSVDFSAQLPLIVAGFVVTLILFFGAEGYAKLFIERAEDKGVFVQGVFRSNMAIIGLATVANAYGKEGLSVGAVYMGVITLVFNVLAVITLSRTSLESESSSASKASHYIMMLVKKIISNPLIISLLAAFAYKALDVSLSLPPLPQVVTYTGELLAALSLPLALICAGATIDIRSMLTLSGLSMQASIGRILIAPIVAVAVGLGFGLTGVHMGVLFLMVASPTAAASYVMAKAMGGNEVLAANILAFTTVFALFGMAIGAAILRGLGWM